MEKPMQIRICDLRDGVTALGPGERYVIWTQGCHRSCPGCMTPEGQSLEGGTLMDTGDLARKILASGREGITVSGGEPFLQAQALAELIGVLRQQRNLGVIVYTGFTLEQLRRQQDPHVDALLRACDLLIDGEYVEALNDGGSLRGSSNQRAIPLTDRYRKDLALYGAPERRIQIVFSEDSATVIGVPGRDLLDRFRRFF